MYPEIYSEMTRSTRVERLQHSSFPEILSAADTQPDGIPDAAGRWAFPCVLYSRVQSGQGPCLYHRVAIDEL